MIAKKLTLQQKILVAGTLFGMFFGAGNLIFPVHLGQMAGRNVLPDWLYHHCCRHSHLRRCCHRRDAFRWSADVIEQGRQGLRRVLYVPSVPNHRTALCHPPLRDNVFYHRRDADADGRLARAAGASDFLGSFLCIRSVLLAQTR